MPTPFKRFTAGQIGELSFDILNDVFSRIEALEQREEPQPRNPRENDFDDMILARLGVRGINNRYAWTEVAAAPNNLSFPSMSGGLVSNVGQDLYATEAVAVDDSVYQVGDIVFLLPARKSDGRAYMAIMRPAGSRVRVFKITASTSIPGLPAGSPAWKYDVIRSEVTFDPATNLYQWTDIAAQDNDVTIALNAAETVGDTATNIGLGTVLPPSVTGYTRQPIKVGTRVLCTDTGGNTLVFSMPNGYAINCGS
jgi:hypothetical protein